MSNINLLDNEFLLLKEDINFSSPISVTFYEYYDTLESVCEKLITEKNNIQCIVSNLGIKNELNLVKRRIQTYGNMQMVLTLSIF